MAIPWKLKSKIFGIIDFLNLEFFLFLLQKYLTKSSIKKVS